MDSFIINNTDYKLNIKITVKFSDIKEKNEFSLYIEKGKIIFLNQILNNDIDSSNSRLKKNKIEKLSVFIYHNLELIFSQINFESNCIISILQSIIFSTNELESNSLISCRNLEKYSLFFYKDIFILMHELDICETSKNKKKINDSYSNNNNSNINNDYKSIEFSLEELNSNSFQNIIKNENSSINLDTISRINVINYDVQIFSIFSNYNDFEYVKQNEKMMKDFFEKVSESNPYNYKYYNNVNSKIDFESISNFFNCENENLILIIGGLSKKINDCNEYFLNETSLLSYDALRTLWINRFDTREKSLLVIYESSDSYLWLKLNEKYEDCKNGIYLQISERFNEEKYKEFLKSNKSNIIESNKISNKCIILNNIVALNINSEDYNFIDNKTNNDYIANENIISRKFNLFILFKDSKCMNFQNNIRKNYSKVHKSIYLSSYFGQYKQIDISPFFIKEGYGIEKTSNGDIYIGFWKNNFYNFYGEYIWSSGNKYYGNLENGNINGFGMYKWKNSDFYIGNFQNGNINGYGIMNWNNGDTYEGFWENDIKKGRGKYTWKNGKIKHGIWNDKKCKRLKEDKEKENAYANMKVNKFSNIKSNNLTLSKIDEVDLSLDLNNSLKDRLLDD